MSTHVQIYNGIYFSHNWHCLWVRNVMRYICLELPVEFIAYFFKIHIFVIMWEKESDTHCLKRSTVLARGSLNNTLMNSFKNCWSQETTHNRSSISLLQMKYKNNCSSILTVTLYSSKGKMVVCSHLLQFSKCFNFVQSWWKCCPSVKQLRSCWDAEYLGVSSGSKLFAYNTVVLTLTLTTPTPDARGTAIAPPTFSKAS